MKYFYNYTITEIDLPKHGYKEGKDINERDIHIPLSKKQLDFLDDNPDVSALEVWNCELVVPIELTNEDLFNPQETLDILEVVMDPFKFGKFSYIIHSMTMKKNFAAINNFINTALLMNEATQAEYNEFVKAFKKQNIRLEDY